MNTDRLLDVLTTNLKPVSRGELHRRFRLALATGAVVAFALMWIIVGPRADISAHLEWLAIKLLFALSLLVIGTPYLIRSLHPGRDDSVRLLVILLPFLVISSAAIAIVLLSPPVAWRGMLLGANSMSPVRCLLLTLSFGTIPLAVLTWALRRGAPTRLERCGALAGLVAGAIGAAAYAFHCASDSVPFIAIWYSAAIAICVSIGALLGPRFLRW